MHYAPGSGSFEAGPTGGATMQQVELSVGFLLRATWSDTRDTLGTVAGTVRRPSAELQRPRGREALSAHPPATVDDTTKGSLDLLEQGPRSRVSLGRGANLVESFAWG